MMYLEDGIQWSTRFTNTILLSEKIWPNDTQVTLHLSPKSDDADLQNITFEKYKYCFIKILQNSIFIGNNEKDYNTFKKYSNFVIDFPVRPVDQMVGTCLFAKLNAIGGDVLKVDGLQIESWQGEHLRFNITQDSPEWDFVSYEKNHWWNDPEPNFSNFKKDRLTWKEIGFTITNSKSHLTVIEGKKNERE